MVNDDGSVVDNHNEIKSHIVSFYENLLGNQTSSSSAFAMDLASLVKFSCSDSDCNFLAAPFIDLEARQAFFSIPSNKSPGSDGFNAECFRGNWETMGKDVIEALLEFLSSGKILKQWNSTTLVMIPKIKNTVKVSNFRPISCCNTLYKVISRLLNDRLKAVFLN